MRDWSCYRGSTVSLYPVFSRSHRFFLFRFVLFPTPCFPSRSSSRVAGLKIICNNTKLANPDRRDEGVDRDRRTAHCHRGHWRWSVHDHSQRSFSTIDPFVAAATLQPRPTIRKEYPFSFISTASFQSLLFFSLSLFVLSLTIFRPRPIPSRLVSSCLVSSCLGVRTYYKSFSTKVIESRLLLAHINVITRKVVDGRVVVETAVLWPNKGAPNKSNPCPCWYIDSF